MVCKNITDYCLYQLHHYVGKITGVLEKMKSKSENVRSLFLLHSFNIPAPEFCNLSLP